MLSLCMTDIFYNYFSFLSRIKTFTSPELKGQLRFSDRLSPVVRLSVRPQSSLRLSINFSHVFSSSPELTLVQDILRCRRFKFIRMKGHSFFEGDIILIKPNHTNKIWKSCSLETLGQFKPNWHNSLVGEGHSSYFSKLRE